MNRAYSAQWAREQAIHAFGTSAIFDLRVRNLKKRLRFVDFWGIAIPLLAGGLALAGIQIEGAGLAVFGVAAVLQVLVFAYNHVNRYPDELESAVEGRRANRELAELYDDATVNAPEPVTWSAIEQKRLYQASVDEKQNLTKEELRYGMRSALKQYQWECVTCGKVPTGLAPGDCDTCGNFNPRWSK